VTDETADDLEEDEFDASDFGEIDLDEHELDENEGAGGDGGEPPLQSGDDDVIVLPWWQHPLNIFTMVVTAAVLAAMIGWMVGDTNSQLAHNEVDTGFLQDMREHHEQAVYMAFVYRSLPDIDAGLNTVAGSIIIGQNQDIGRMVQMLRMFGETESNEGETSMAWMGMPVPRGEMPGMATEDQLDHLATLSGKEADEFFVQLMTDHHNGGIHMAEYAAGNGKSDEVREMAAAMAKSQADENSEMQLELNN
jgi:uncharacterized protein (DUF305 family)